LTYDGVNVFATLAGDVDQIDTASNTATTVYTQIYSLQDILYHDQALYVSLNDTSPANIDKLLQLGPAGPPIPPAPRGLGGWGVGETKDEQW
jgi:hypothetical protein